MLIKAARKVRSSSKLVAAALPAAPDAGSPLPAHPGPQGSSCEAAWGLTGHFRDTLRHRTRRAQPYVHVA
jgi:hypothetical protein